MKEQEKILVRRKNNLTAFIHENTADLYLSSLEPDIYYFTNFIGEGIYVYGKGIDTLLTSKLYLERAESVVKTSQVIVLEKRAYHHLKELLPEKGLRGVVSHYESIDFLKNIRKAGVKAVLRETRTLRAVKDHSEIKLIRKAYRIVEEAILQSLAITKEGLTEVDLSVELEYRLRKNGAQKLAFEPIVAFGERTSVPHAIPGKRKLKIGDLVLIDAGARFEGYCSDITRCFAFGKAEKEIKDMYLYLSRISKLAVETLLSGENRANKIDLAARKVLKKAGIEKYFVHGLGHGLGLQVHELPVINTRSKDILKDGMVFTIEPGVYFNGKYGLRLEDGLYLDGEPKLLSNLTRKFVEI